MDGFFPALLLGAARRLFHREMILCAMDFQPWRLGIKTRRIKRPVASRGQDVGFLRHPFEAQMFQALEFAQLAQ
ncbi:hypothetical protein D3C71_2163010 [compost metagenome]